MGHGKIKIGQSAFSASQVGTLYGCGWGTMLELYNRYKGINAVSAEPSPEAKESMEFGTFFEDAVAKYFANKMGFKIKKCGETAYWADDMPYFICHPDRLVVGKDDMGRRVALEIKCVSPYSNGWGESGTTEIPDVYFFQVQSYFACSVPCDVVYVVCMRGNRIYSYEILPDEEIIADIRYRVAKAKADFDAGIIPSSENCSEAIMKFKDRIDPLADAVGANDDAVSIYNKLIEVHKNADAVKKQEESLKAQLAEYMGTAPAVVITEGTKVKKICSWATKNTTSFDFDKLSADHPDINLNDYRSSKQSTFIRISYPREEN